MVGRHDNQRLIGVLLIELVGHANGIVHINQFGDESQVVAVAGPVDFAPFDHQEETVLLLLFLVHGLSAKHSVITYRNGFHLQNFVVHGHR